MLLEHKNLWFETIDESRIELSRFKVLERDDETFIIELKNTPLVFKIKQKNDDFDLFTTNNTEYKPNFPLRISSEDFENGSSTYETYNVQKQLTQWLNLVVARYIAEKELPDFWAEAQSSFSQSSSIPEEELQTFTEEEKKQIKSGIENFKEIIKEKFGPIEEQLNAINERLDYLSKAVDRLNRFDWKAQLVSTLISIGVNLGVDKESGKQLLSYFQQTLGIIISKFIQIHIPPLIP